MILSPGKRPARGDVESESCVDHVRTVGSAAICKGGEAMAKRKQGWKHQSWSWNHRTALRFIHYIRTIMIQQRLRDRCFSKLRSGIPGSDFEAEAKAKVSPNSANTFVLPDSRDATDQIDDKAEHCRESGLLFALSRTLSSGGADLSVASDSRASSKRRASTIYTQRPVHGVSRVERDLPHVARKDFPKRHAMYKRQIAIMVRTGRSPGCSRAVSVKCFGAARDETQLTAAATPL